MTAAKGGKRVGYIRVSSVDQNTERQLDGVQLDKKFEDKCSGKDTKRPQLQAALEYMREGDVLVVHSMDRLSRSLRDLLKLVEDLNGRGIAVEFVKQNLAFTGDDSASSKLMLSIMGAVAEFERDMIRERQREGIQIAKAKGNVFKGRVRALSVEQEQELRKRASAGENKSALAREFGLTRASVYNYLSY
jgi:DNA invertase Pin-like site-specific DNA recombinase